MMKRGKHVMSGFKRRWFVLSGGTLRYFRRPDDAGAKGVIVVVDIESVNPVSERTLKVAVPGRKFLLRCKNVGERDAWVVAIESARQSQGDFFVAC